MWRHLGVLSVCALVQPASAWANEAWRAPAGCPSSEEVFASAPAHPGALRALGSGLATVRIDRAPTGELRAQLRVGADRGELETRELRASDCTALSEGVLLVLDMASRDIQPLAEQPPDLPEEVEATPQSLPSGALGVVEARGTPPQRTDAEPAVGLAAPRHRAPRPPSHFGALAMAQLDAGSLSGPTLGVSVGAVWARGRAWLDLRGSYLVPRGVRLVGQRSVGMDLDLAMATVRACLFSRDRRPSQTQRLRLSGCLAVEVGAARGRSVNLDDGRQGRGPFAAMLIGATLSLGPYRGVLPFVQLEFGPVLTSPVFEISSSSVHHSEGWVARLSIGSAWLSGHHD